MQYEYSDHALAVLVEREIDPSWVDATLNHAERTQDHPDGTTHHLRRIEAFGGRWLRVVLNRAVSPALVVTVFFDRRVQ